MKTTPLYKVTFQMGDVILKTKAPILVDAIFSIKPEKIFTKAIFTVEFNGKKSSQSRMVGMTRRILTSHLVAEVFSRNLMMKLN